MVDKAVATKEIESAVLKLKDFTNKEQWIKVADEYEAYVKGIDSKEKYVAFKFDELNKKDENLNKMLIEIVKIVEEVRKTDVKKLEEIFEKKATELKTTHAKLKDESEDHVYFGSTVNGKFDGEAYYEKKGEHYRYAGHWKEDNHDGKGILLMKNKEGTETEFFSGVFSKGEEAYKLEGLSLVYKKDVFVLTEGRSEKQGDHIDGIYVYYDVKEHTIDIFFGELVDFKKNKAGISIRAKVDQNDVSKSEVSLYIGEYEKDQKKGDFKVYQKNSHLLSLSYDINNNKVPVSKGNSVVKHVVGEKKCIYYGPVEFANDKFTQKGKGTIFYDNNHVFIGNFEVKEGKSVRGDENGVYYLNKADNPVVIEGQFVNDHLVKGKLTKDGKTIFEGDFKNNEMSRGKYYYDNGDVYEGDFFGYKRHGNGKYMYHDGQIYDGDWHEGKRKGEGIYQKGADHEKLKYKWDNDKQGELVVAKK